MVVATVLRIGWLEAVALARATGWIALALALGTIGLLLVQEPSFARGSDAIPFVAAGVDAFLAAIAIAVPLAWGTARGSGHAPAPCPLRAAIGLTLGQVALVGAIAGGSLAVLFTLERISWSGAIAIAVRVLLVATPLAALAPAVFGLTRSTAGAAFVWGCVVAGSVGVFGLGMPIPLDRLAAGPAHGLPDPELVIAAVLSTVAALSLASAVLRRRATR